MEIIPLNKTSRAALQENDARGVQRRNDIFPETGFTGPTDFIFFRYSAINNDLLSNNRFRFQGNAVRVNRIRQSMRNISGPTLWEIQLSLSYND
jgi:hypothetical protein